MIKGILRDYYHIILAKFNIVDCINRYKRKILKYSPSCKGDFSKERMRQSIIIDTHVIEKGLTHSDYRAGFGRATVESLVRNIDLYSQLSDIDMFALDNARGVLNEYKIKNKEHGFDDTSYVPNYPEKLNMLPEEIVSKDSIESEGVLTRFNIFAESRHSVRWYDSKGLKIERALLKKIVSIAQTTPSACNRQATHVFVCDNESVFDEISKLQLGCRGFGENVSVFIFIASDISLYTAKEVKLPIFDAGLFTMNLLYALHSAGLHTCILNASFDGKSINRIHNLAGIPNEYEINGLIAVYKLEPNRRILVPKSPKRQVDEILHFS